MATLGLLFAGCDIVWIEEGLYGYSPTLETWVYLDTLEQVKISMRKGYNVAYVMFEDLATPNE